MANVHFSNDAVLYTVFPNEPALLDIYVKFLCYMIFKGHFCSTPHTQDMLKV